MSAILTTPIKLSRPTSDETLNCFDDDDVTVVNVKEVKSMIRQSISKYYNYQSIVSKSKIAL
jgi:hypothetical protein